MSDWSKPEIYAFSFQCGFEIKKENKFLAAKGLFEEFENNFQMSQPMRQEKLIDCFAFDFED